MRNIWIGLFFWFLFAASGSAAEYPVSSIPEGLKKNANLVLRDNKLQFEVKDAGRAIIKRKIVITVLNPEGAHAADVYVQYDKFSKIREMRGRVLSEKGVEVNDVKKSEIKDYSKYDGFSIYSDNRLKYMNLKWSKYPYTIDIYYEIEYDGLLFYPNWRPVGGYEESVEQSTFVVTTPSNLPLRYSADLISEPEISESDKIITYSWKLSNYRAIEKEPMAPLVSQLLPSVRTAPTHLTFGDYSGPMDTWDAIGRWQNYLNDGRNDLPEETIRKIDQMTLSAESIEEKARIVYQYLQDNTRYVSIQLGIGGWQPFRASFVDEKGYGDCKALTFYTKSMLEAAGVESYYTLVRAGKNAQAIDPDFPSRQFNHVILCVPNGLDSIWLECTSQTNTFGYLSSFTGDRNVLLINKEGAKVVKTPTYSQEDNLIIRSGTVKLDEDGNGRVEVTTIYQGLKQEDDGIRRYIRADRDTQKKWLYSKMDIPSFQINSFDFNQINSEVPGIRERLDLTVKNYAAQSGKRFFLNPNMFSRWEELPLAIEDRSQEIILKSEYILVDSLHYLIPAGFYPEFTPKNLKLETQFGKFETSTIVDASGLIFVRRLEVNKGRFPAATYSELREFMKQIVKSDKGKIVLVNKT